MVFLRFDLESFGLERSGRLIVFIPPNFVNNAWCRAKLCPNNRKKSRLLNSRLLKFERNRTLIGFRGIKNSCEEFSHFINVFPLEFSLIKRLPKHPPNNTPIIPYVLHSHRKSRYYFLFFWNIRSLNLCSPWFFEVQEDWKMGVYLEQFLYFRRNLTSCCWVMNRKPKKSTTKKQRRFQCECRDPLKRLTGWKHGKHIATVRSTRSTIVWWTPCVKQTMSCGGVCQSWRCIWPSQGLRIAVERLFKSLKVAVDTGIDRNPYFSWPKGLAGLIRSFH